MPTMTPAPTRLLPLREGELGTVDTVSVMRRLILAGRQNPLIRQFTCRLVGHLPQKDKASEIRTIHAFVRDRIRYIHDIRGVETVHTPEFILQNGYGDCDDKTVLCAAMLESIGYKTRITVIGFGGPGTGFCHVYPEVVHDGAWLPLECTEPVSVGWEAPGVNNKRHFEV